MTTTWKAVWSALLLLVATAPARAVTGGEVIERMQARFAEARTYEARFEKQFYWAVLDKHLSREGRIYTRRPGQFRVEVEDGDIVVADGSAIWAYSQANHQVIVSRYAGELRTPWEILVDYARHYGPVAVQEVELEGEKAYEVTLLPKPEVPTHLQLQRLRVWVKRGDWDLLRVEQVEANDDVRTYVLKDHRRNRNLKSDLFKFAPPEGAEVIDRRQPDEAP